MKKHNIIFALISTVLLSCSSKNTFVYNIDTRADKTDIFLSIHRNAEHIFLIIPDDDSVSIQDQFNYLQDILPANSQIALFPKLFYKNKFEKNNVDSPELRKEKIANNINMLLKEGVLDSNLSIKVLAIGEGTIVAPQMAISFNAEELVLINPFVEPLSLNFYNIYGKEGSSYKALSKYTGLETRELWNSFLYEAENNLNPDRYPTNRPMRYYSNYWNYDPGLYLSQYRNKITIVQFANYNYTSSVNKNKAKKKGANNYAHFVGNMFSTTFKNELKKILNN